MNSPYSGKSVVLGTLIGGLLLGGVNTYVVKSYGFYTSTALKDAVVSVQFWMLGALIIGNTIRYYFPKQSRIVFFMGLVVTLTAIWVLLTGFLLHFVQRKTLGYYAFFELSLPVRIAFTLLLFTALSMIFAFLHTLHEQHLTEAKNDEVWQLARKAELNNLQEKLQPHFLFNSLNSINALIAIDPNKARDMVQQLSDFLRGTLKREHHEWISLAQELHYLELYLEIEKVRFGHRLQTSLTVEEGAAQALLPPFILLPVLENAIKFGLYDTLHDIHISVFAKRTGNMLEVSVANPFDGETAGQYKGTGFGLKSVQRRLHLLFDRTDLLITRSDDQIFTTTVLIPQTT